MKKTIYNACDLLDTQELKNVLSGKRLGLVTNISGVTRDLQKTSVCLSQMYDLIALFSPEHGLSSVQQAGGFDNTLFIDPETGVNVYNLFDSKDNKQQVEKVLSELDALVFDIQDIGVRYYTYQYTMLDAMQLCKKAQLPFIVLDRLNPLGGMYPAGNLLEKDCISAVGRVEGQPVESAMTVGELALWYNEHMNIHTDLQVIRCDGWKREYTFDDTDLLFVPPSPNMPSPDTVFLYSGTCLFEGTNISEARGTTKPFEMFGAPWLEPKRVIDALRSLPPEAKTAFEGLVFRPCSFVPFFSDYAGIACNGLQLHIRDKKAADMFATGLYLLSVIRALYPQQCEFSDFLAQLAGTKQILSKDFDAVRYVEEQRKKTNAFNVARKQFLLY